MKSFTDVYLREFDKKKTVAITSDDKPKIIKSMINKWQNIINLIATIIDVPAGLIMQITEQEMQVFLKSNNEENPYVVGGADKLGHGLYCETVIANDNELLIENALKQGKWATNPDVKLDMISYYGLPIKWPDEEFFGTICILDNKENNYNDQFKELIMLFKNTIESDLEILMLQDELQSLAEIDVLTNVYNRRKCETILQEEFSRSNRNGDTLSLAMIDLNKFKLINDTYGHEIGDKVLQVFANELRKRIRLIDTLGRWGGDEFILVCPSTNFSGISHLIGKVKDDVEAEMRKVVAEASFSYGIASSTDEDKSHADIIRRADREMYRCKSEM